MSNQQMLRLFWRATAPARRGASIAAQVLVVLFCALRSRRHLKWLNDGLAHLHIAPSALNFVEWFGAVCLLLILWNGPLLFRVLGDLAFGTVASIEGRVSASEERVTDLTIGGALEEKFRYYLRGLEFQVSAAAGAALEERARYRVYFAPRSKVLLSIEPIASD